MNKKKLFASIIGGVTFDADYQAVLNRGSALGYALPTPGQQVKQNAYVLALKAAGIWALLDVLYVFATNGDSNYATLNWKAPTLFQCAKVNSPTFTANLGFNGNGTTSYLNTTWIPSVNGVNYVLNNSSFGGQVNTDQAAANDIVYGATTGVNTSYLITKRLADSQAQWFINNNVGVGTGAAASTGLFHVKRIDAINISAYRNGVLIASVAGGSSGRPATSFFIGGRSDTGVLTLPSSKQIANFWAGAGLNGLEAANYNAWNTYFTSL